MELLLNFWFPELKYQSFWFDGSKDQEIYEKFNQELIIAEQLTFDDIVQLSNTQKMYYLILYDQITRNIARIDKSNPYRNDDKALKLSYDLLEKKYDDSLPFLYKIFILLPLRHNGSLVNLKYVLQKLDSYHQNLKDEEKNDYKKFYLATLQNFSQNNENIVEIKKKIHSLNFHDNLHDSNCKKYTNELPIDIVDEMKSNLMYISVWNYCKKYKLKRLAVSLSGGVDSMVLLYILHQLLHEKKLDYVVAVHVNYNWECRNGECKQEADFLVDFCSYLSIHMVLCNITHFTSKIDEMIDVEREFVDEETKNIRFNTYKYAIKKYNLDGICLGHHKGDLIENVFMNLAKGKNILDLFVTKEYDIQYEVPILRPMLDHDKDVIYDIAHKYCILYFKDTTPDWSFRGTMRRKMFPSMTNFDPMILNNFYRIGEQSAEWGTFINSKLMKPILDNVVDCKYGFIVPFNIGYNDIPLVFWSELFVNLFHTRQIRMIKQANIKCFVQWINTQSNKTLFRLSNGLMVFKDDGNLYFFQTKIYEILKKSQDKKIITYNLEFDQEHVNYCMWNLTFNITSNNKQYDISYQDILNGDITYTIPYVTSEIQVSSNGKIRYMNPFGNILVDQIVSIIPKVPVNKNHTDQFLMINMKMNL